MSPALRRSAIPAISCSPRETAAYAGRCMTIRPCGGSATAASRIGSGTITSLQSREMLDESGRRGIAAFRRDFALNDRQELRGELFAEFDAPLVEGIDVPDRCFRENPVLEERDKPAER